MTGAITTVVRFASLDRWDAQTIPQEVTYVWPAAPLGDVAEIRLGVQVPRKGSKPHGVARPYLRSINVRRGFVDLSDLKEMHVSQSQAEALALQAGDLVFVEGSGSVTEVGRTAIWNGDLPEVIHQNSVIRARLNNPALDPEFVVTWFNSRAGNAYVREHATTTSGLYHLGAGKLAGAPVPQPPLDIQRQLVAEYKATRDSAARASHDAGALKDSAWEEFCTRLVETPDAATASDIVVIASFSMLDRWDTNHAPTSLQSPYPLVTLADVAEIRLGTQVPRKGSRAEGIEVPYLRAKSVQLGYIDFDDLKSMTVPPITVERLALETSDVLFVEGNSREEVGRAAVWEDTGTTTIIQNSVIRARLHCDDLDPEFVVTWFNSDAGRAYARGHATTTTGSLWHIGAGKLAQAPIPLPPIEEQRRLVAKLKEDLAAAKAREEEFVRLREEAEQMLESSLIHFALPERGAGLAETSSAAISSTTRRC